MAQNNDVKPVSAPAAKYEVLISFTDADDKNKVYWTGDVYPRFGYEPTEDRIAYLQGDKNAFKAPVISKAKK